MGTIIVIVLVLVVLDLLAWRWGFKSADSTDGPEWERLHDWKAFH